MENRDSPTGPESKEREARWTPVFERIPEEKRRRVLDAALRSFATRGFAGTNVNLVAAEAGISVGALYKYFRNKEDLFLALVESAHDLLESTLDGIFAGEAGFAGRVEAVLRAAIASSRENPDLARLYIACTTEELAPLASRLSFKLESVGATRYRAMIEEGRRRGEIPAGIDPGTGAFLMDDIFLMIQFSFGAEYYRNRLRLFLGEIPTDSEALVSAARDFILRAFGVTPGTERRSR